LLNQVINQNKTTLSPDAILKQLEVEKPEVLLILGAGDIDRIVEPIRKIYEKH
jgi:UDP-N-acetylmuramate--alanine ligase